MSIPARLEKLIKTEKQRHFPKDFMVGWKDYETWEDATVGQSGPAQRTFAITEEDILDSGATICWPTSLRPESCCSILCS